MKTRDLLTVQNPYPKVSGSFNWRLIPKRLEDLAKRGVYFDDRMV